MNIGLILAAGSGNRFGKKIPKQFSLLNNKMLIDYSVQKFSNSKFIDKIIIVAHKEWVSKLKHKYKVCKIIAGGKTRRESSFLGLKSCPNKTKNVLIHDSARPFITTDKIDECISNLDYFDSVLVSEKVTNTIIRINQKVEVLNRNFLYSNQTPQGFRFKIIMNAHKTNNKKDLTDDFSLLDSNKTTFKIISPPPNNIKITSQEDLVLANAIIEKNNEFNI